jgi:hypothetical protein
MTRKGLLNDFSKFKYDPQMKKKPTFVFHERSQ